MILTMSADVSAFKSKSQIARVLSEAWTSNNAYCPRCGAERLLHERNNKPAEDFSCPACGNVYEQKSKKGRFSSKVVDGDYKIMADKIRMKTNPDMLFLSYDGARSIVVDFFVVPRHFFTISAIERRTALSEGSRRAGWVGCSILLSKIPEEGRVHMVRGGKILDKSAVLRKFQRTAFLERQTLEARGWMLDVWSCADRLPTEFSLQEVYAFEAILSRAHPENRHVKAKIRQQLQLLRERGLVEFLGNGRYRKIS